MPLTTQYVDFPIGYAELINNKPDDTVFYVEWLDNNNEFPDLKEKPPTTDDTWEILQDPSDNWSEVNHFDVCSYVEMAEKNASLQPAGRALQPQWPIMHRKTAAKNEAGMEEDMTDLYDVYKSTSRVANRSSYSKRTLSITKAAQMTPSNHLEFCSTVDLAKYKYAYSHGTKNYKKDYSEFSVLDSLKKR